MKKLKYITKKDLYEMAMDFDSPDRPTQDVQNRLERGMLPIGKVPMPKTDREDQNFMELLASSRYKQLIQKFKEITGYRGTIQGETPSSITQIMMNAVHEIEQKETNYRRQLEQLAVKTGLDLFGLDPTKVKVKGTIEGLRGMGNIPSPQNTGDVTQQPQKEVEMKAVNAAQKFDLEKTKRRLINSLIQGAGNITQYSGEFLKNRLENKLTEITGDPNIFNKYLIMMSSNDLMYWQMSDISIMRQGSSKAGSEQVKKNDDGSYEIVAKGINFIVLLHEIIKGIMEYLALIKRDETYAEVYEIEDSLAAEMWDLRLGPEIFDRYRNFFTDIIYEFEDVNIGRLQSYFWSNIFELPAKQFLSLNIEVLGKTQKGKELMKYFFNGLYANMIDDEDMYQENIQSFYDMLDELAENISDEEIDDILDDLLGDIGGITRGN